MGETKHLAGFDCEHALGDSVEQGSGHSFEIFSRVPLAEAVRQLKLVPQSRYDDAAAFFG